MGALVVTVVVVVAFVVFRNVFSDEPDTVVPDAVEYLPTVQQVQAAGDITPVYPAQVPDGWIVSAVRLEPDDTFRFELNFFTGGDDFVGLRQQDVPVEELLDTYVDDDTVSDDDLTGVGSLAGTWEGWRDSGGDHAFSAEVDGTTVLVFGDVPAAELADLVGRLTDEDLPGSGATPAPSPTG